MVRMYVYADWQDLNGPLLMGELTAESLRGKEVFSFAYDKGWLRNEALLALDPDLGLYSGPQYLSDGKVNFGVFTDSSPDRWGRVLMQRREALRARQEGRKPKALLESDYLLGVFDSYRMGALRFKLDPEGPFVDDHATMAAPPMTSLRTLEEASLHLEDKNASDDPDFSAWLNQLLSPGASLGGARPKASVIDPAGQLWIAKFPSRSDDHDIGGWEGVVNILAQHAGVNAAQGNARRLTRDHHTFLTCRFDRDGAQRIHFASAMTLLGKTDGADASDTSYLHLAEIIQRYGAQPDRDMEELWRRIVFNIAISNTDDHLRNHGFLLTAKGWELSPAYDMNPVINATGLTLNITEDSNALDLGLAREVAEQFRVQKEKSERIIEKVMEAVSHWHEVAAKLSLSRSERERMETAFSSK